MTTPNTPGGTTPTGIHDDDLTPARTMRLTPNRLPVATITTRGTWYGHSYFTAACPCHGREQTYETPQAPKPPIAGGSRDLPAPYRVTCETSGKCFRVEDAPQQGR